MFALNHYGFLIQRKSTGKDRGSKRISYPDGIQSFLQNPCRLLLTIGSKLIQRKRNRHGRRLARCKKTCFSKSGKTAELFFQFSLRTGNINLNHFFSRIRITGVCYGYHNTYPRIFCIETSDFDRTCFNRKIRVGKTVAKRISYRHIKGIKITIADIDSLFVLLFHQIFALIAEFFCSRIIRIGKRPGIRHFTGWCHFSCYHIRKGISTFLSSLHKLYDGPDIGKLIDECKIHKATRIHDQNNILIGLGYLPEKLFFFFGNEIVSFRVKTVFVLSGNPGQNKKGGICSILLCLIRIDRISCRQKERSSRISIKEISIHLFCFCGNLISPGFPGSDVQGIVGIQP